MKIAFVYDVAYPYSLGGGEKRTWEVARRLADLGHDVSLISMHMWEGESKFTREGVRCVGICPWREDLLGKGRRSLGEPLYFAKHVYRYLKNHEFDVVDCANFPYLPCIAARLALKGTKTKLVITWYEARGLKRWIEHRGVVGVAAWFLNGHILQKRELPAGQSRAFDLLVPLLRLWEDRLPIPVGLSVLMVAEKR